MDRKRPNHEDHGGYNKKQRPNTNTANHGQRGMNGPRNGPIPQKAPTFHDKTNPILRELAQLPDPERCDPCKLASEELQSGMVALLDQLVQDEAGGKRDKDVLHHARELHGLLSKRLSVNFPSKPIKDLDSKRPETIPKINIPPYIAQPFKLSKSLPPLPPITEPYLQEAVFTHTTANDSKSAKTRGYRGTEINYERLEFLGDAYIEIIASRLIYSRFPDVEASKQSYWREQLVRNETLCQYSKAYGLGNTLKHGPHIPESKSWGKILADVFEAYVAALVLSTPDSAAGFQTAESWLTELWSPKLLEFNVQPIENPKARDEINKLVMAKGIKLDYREERKMELTKGKQKFFIGLYLTGWGFVNEHLGSGEGQNKSQACVFAAQDALLDKRGIVKRANAEKLKVYPPKPKEDVA
ncbi:ribonuclease III [Sporormia fimetaria CBS 119925]|uniref:Ribonuclease III n=1 Tax=Sporormia fimetaria CBS 119925 TaxID=1340428 RepID=A0A6A6VKS9_9PLEO|nr:ribonuclease III [Sporormia fimetaria CBS 119925]